MNAPSSNPPQVQIDSPEDVPPLEFVKADIGSMMAPNRVVLREVNWQISKGDFWIVGGLQATGKGDLLATAAGLMSPLNGVRKIFGRELSSRYQPELLDLRLKVGLVFGGGRLLQHLTVLNNILLPLRYHLSNTDQELETYARELLDLVEMHHHAEAYPGSLGLNWQQRIGLARALALRPELLLLDNPLSGLDPMHHAWWLEILDRLAVGHPVMQNKPLTLATTGDDFSPWKGHARQYAILKRGTFRVLQPTPDLQDDVRLRSLLGLTPEAHPD